MSTLKVGTIQDHANSNTAIEIDSGGRPLFTGQPCVAVMCSNTNSFGTDSNSTYDISYLSPMPTFTSGTTTTQVNRGGMTLTFPTHPEASAGNYAKIVVPVTGVYEYRFYGGIRNYVMNDWWTHGVMVNSVSTSANGTPTFNLWNWQLNNASDQNDDEFMSAEHSGVFALNANDYVVPYVQSVQKISFEQTSMKHGFILRQV